MGQRSTDPSSTTHRTTPSTTPTMKIAIVALVLVAAVSVNGGVLSGNGMDDIDSIIDSIVSMSAGATDLNTMESRLKGLEAQKSQIDNALAALKTNLDKTDLGTNSAKNTHANVEVRG